jgi:hypothetical protein
MHRGALVCCPRLAWTGHGQALIGLEGGHWRPRRFGCVGLPEARIPVRQGRGAGAGSGASGSRVDREGVVLIVRAGSGDRGVGWPSDGASAAAACGGDPWVRQTGVGAGRTRWLVGEERRPPVKGGRCCWPAGAVMYCALAQVTRLLKRVVAAPSDSWPPPPEWAAKLSQHSWAARIGGLLSGVKRPKTAQKRPTAAGWQPCAAAVRSASSARSTASTSRSPDRRLGREAS